MKKINAKRMGPLYRTRPFQDSIEFDSLYSSVQSESIFFPVITRRNDGTFPETRTGKGTKTGNFRFLFPAISCPENERKVTSCNRSFSVESVHRETTIQIETVKSVRQSIPVKDFAVSVDLTDACLHVPIHPRSRKYLRFMFENQVFQFTALPFGMFLSSWIFTKLMDISGSFASTCHLFISVPG